MDYMETLNFTILINGTLAEFFYLTSALCQGCPLSPYLFNLFTDVLSHALQVMV